MAGGPVKSYKNPVVDYSLPDPTVIKGDDGYFYLYNDNIPIGSCLVTSILPDCACISEVAIDDNFQNKGYGYKFLAFVFRKISKDYHFVVLHVEKGNIPAYKLYTKMGFVEKETSVTYSKSL